MQTTGLTLSYAIEGRAQQAGNHGLCVLQLCAETLPMSLPVLCSQQTELKLLENCCCSHLNSMGLLWQEATCVLPSS